MKMKSKIEILFESKFNILSTNFEKKLSQLEFKIDSLVIKSSIETFNIESKEEAIKPNIYRRKISAEIETLANESNLKNIRIQQDFPRDNERKKRKLFRVCLTGGPCAGKSSALLHVKQALEYEKIQVIIVPEASTLLYTCSLNWKLFVKNHTINFQLGLLKTQLALEGIFTETAQ